MTILCQGCVLMYFLNLAPNSLFPITNLKESWKGDKYCDNENNHAECEYDGGDCCPPRRKNAWDYYCSSQTDVSYKFVMTIFIPYVSIL